MSMSPHWLATAIATDDFPDAVEPMTAIRGGRALRAPPPEFGAGELVQQRAQQTRPEGDEGRPG